MKTLMCAQMATSHAGPFTASASRRSISVGRQLRLKLTIEAYTTIAAPDQRRTASVRRFTVCVRLDISVADRRRPDRKQVDGRTGAPSLPRGQSLSLIDSRSKERRATERARRLRCGPDSRQSAEKAWTSSARPGPLFDSSPIGWVGEHPLKVACLNLRDATNAGYARLGVTSVCCGSCND